MERSDGKWDSTIVGHGKENRNYKYDMYDIEENGQTLR